MADKSFMSSIKDAIRKIDQTPKWAAEQKAFAAHTAAQNAPPAFNAAKDSASAYPHDTNNNQTDVVLEFQPNVLDAYDAVTYHWKLFMVTNEDSKSGKVLDINSQVVIAESGISDYTIDKVEIESVATLSIEAGTGTMTTVKFEIVEPSGAALLDKMFYESVALGVGDWKTMPIYLQLEFRGRTPGTSESSEDGKPGPIGKLKWVWPIRLSTVDANVTHVGTRYSFNAIVYNELAQSNSYFSIQHSVTLRKLTTFQSAIDELYDKIKLDQAEKLIDNYSIEDRYNFVIDPKIAEYKITPTNSNTNSVRNNSYVSWDEKSATFNPGTGIDKIIDTLLSQTDEYQKGMVGSTAPGKEGAPISQETNQMKKIWRIITETKPREYDARRQIDAVDITIFVVDYDIGILDSNVFQSTVPESNNTVSKNRLKAYVNKALLKKKYNYIFTGINDQVFAIDLKLNYAFASGVSRYGGIYSNSAMTDTGLVNHDHAEEEAALTKKVRSIISLRNSADTGSLSSANSQAEELSKSIKTSSMSAAAQARLQRALDVSSLTNRVAPATTPAGFGSNTRFADSSLVQGNYNVSPAFLSSVDLTSDKAKNMYRAVSAGADQRSIPHLEKVDEGSLGSGLESNSNSGISKLSSMFSVALHSPYDANLVHISLKIKGDPYWLFPQATEDNEKIAYNSDRPPAEAIEYLKRSQFSQPNSVNINGGDNFILLRFKTPRIYSITDSTNDESKTDDVEIFSGIYKITTIHNKFEMGKFTQDMNCILDNIIKLSDIRDMIEADAKKIDVISYVPTTSNVIPATAISTDRIAYNNISAYVPGAVPNTINQLSNNVSMPNSTGNTVINVVKPV